ncbi:hypothetical protein [Methylobacterium sp. A54F]
MSADFASANLWTIGQTEPDRFSQTSWPALLEAATRIADTFMPPALSPEAANLRTCVQFRNDDTQPTLPADAFEPVSEPLRQQSILPVLAEWIDRAFEPLPAKDGSGSQGAVQPQR